MRTSSKSIIAASLILPLLLLACDRAEQSPTAPAGTNQQSPAMNPSPSPADQATEKSPPSPADLSRNPAAPPSTTEPAPVDQKTEPKPAN